MADSHLSANAINNRYFKDFWCVHAGGLVLRYKAFISYRRNDAMLTARWIRNRLLTFRAPDRLVEQLPQLARTALRDRDGYYLDTSYQVASEDFWTENILPALQDSERLIVLSSPSALERPAGGGDNWVAREIDTFLRIHGDAEGRRRIILVLGRGAPTDRFPGRMGALGENWDWVDLRELSPWAWLRPGASERLGDAFLKIAAAIFRVPPDLVPLLRQEEARRRGRARLIAVAAAFAVILALSAALGWAVVERQEALMAERRAVHNYEAARDTVDRLVAMVGGGLRDTQGITVQTVDRALSQVDRLVSDLEHMTTNDPLLQRSRAGMLHEFARTYRQAGDDVKARQAEDRSTEIRRRLVATMPDMPELSVDLAASLELLGDLDRSAHQLADARRRFAESLSYRQMQLQRFPAHKDRDEWLFALSQSEVRLGDIDLEESRLFGARDTPRTEALQSSGAAHYRRSLAAGAELYLRAPDSERWQRELSWGFYKRADFKVATGQPQAALEDYDSALCLRRELTARAPYNTRYVSDVAWTLQKIGASKIALARWAEAEAALLESIALRRRLVTRDVRDDKTLSRDYYFSIERLAVLKQQTNVPDVAFALVIEGKRVQQDLRLADGTMPASLEVPSLSAVESWARDTLLPQDLTRIELDPNSVLNAKVLAEASKLLTPRGDSGACLAELAKALAALAAVGSRQ